MSSILLTGTIVALFLVLFACIKFALQETAFRDSKTIAPAATILCLLGMSGPFQVNQVGSLPEVALLPWATLGFGILFIVLLCLIHRLCRFREVDNSAGISDEVAGSNLWDHDESRVTHPSYDGRVGPEVKHGKHARRKRAKQELL